MTTNSQDDKNRVLESPLTGVGAEQGEALNERNGMKAIICIGGRCSSWGKSWKKHLYGDESDDCLRCGMNRREQWEEDKAAHLVTGDYKPRQATLKKRGPKMSDKLMYCALGDYGIEYVAPTRKQVEDWIADEVAGTGHSDEPMPEDYYSITTHTQAELDAMPEV